MQKASLYVWLMTLLSYPVISTALSNDLSLYFYSGKTQLKIEQNTSYVVSTFPNWAMQIRGRNLEDKRIDFDQTSRNSLLEVSLNKSGRLIQQDLQTGYEYLYDFSNLESEKQPYSNKTGFLGYGIGLTPLDSLNITANLRGYYRQEQDRYIPAHKLSSRGLLEKIDASYMVGDTVGFVRFNGNIESKKLNWEQYQTASAGILSDYRKSFIQVNCLVNASTKTENLYILTDSSTVNNTYVLYDRQQRTNLNAALNLYLPMGENLDCRIAENYNLLNYRHQTNRSRNTGDYNNQAQYELAYILTGNIGLHSSGFYNYYIKDLPYIHNTRVIDVRNAGLGLNWEYTEGDSLLFDYTVELRRSTYPDTEHKLDNDYLSTIYKLGWIMFWKERVRLDNRFFYLKKDEIYINAGLSANNNTMNSLQWQPECDILVGDCLVLSQSYQLRADYDNYYYNDIQGVTDTFYRQLLMSYHAVYDTSPLVAKLDLLQWNRIPYRTRNSNAWRIDAGYSREINETYAKTGNLYYRTDTIDLRQSLSLLLQKQFGLVICQLYPKYSWGTWKEYNLLLSSAWQLNQNSLLEIGINPLGPELDEIDWRVFCSLNLTF